MAVPPLNVALVAVGSHGDVHPFVGIGSRLAGRGHRVTVLANDHFEPLIRKAGLGFESFGTDAEYRELAANPDLWNGRKAFHVIARNVADLVRRVYEPLRRMHREHGDRLVVAGSSLAIGARVAQDEFGLKLATVHLSPAVFQSVHEMPHYPGLAMPRWAPRWFKRATYSAVNGVIDRAMAPAVNDFRKTLGLPPVRGILKQYWNSPQLVLAMFPAWYAAVQPDWPANTVNVGFPLYDEADVTPMPPALETFLAAGPPPIAFTPGSAMFTGRAFFDASVEACRRLGRRGVLLSRHGDHIPPGLPPDVIHADYAPFSELFPRCAAVVHHGGIGTSAQALAAGVPQVVQAFAHDQPDNADRLRRLGVARAVPAKRYTARSAAAALADLLSSPAVAEACRATAARVKGVDAIGDACDQIEMLHVAVAPTP